MLSVKKISASYGHVQALSGVSLEVPEKGTVTLIGSNGAGKSSLLKVISGLLKPSQGSIEFGGERIEGLPPDRIVALGISHCPEGRRLFPELTVFENLEMGAYLSHSKKVGTVNVAATTEEGEGDKKFFKRIPKQSELKLDPDASYVHFTSNNTIFGTQWHTEPQVGNVPLVCDASSHILHKKIDIKKYGLVYAGAQKNMGPAGITLVIMRKDLLERSQDSLHTMLNYKIHAENDSLYNTPTTFAIYINMLVTRWLLKNGGLNKMYEVNKHKADLLYKCIDDSNGYYKGHAEKDSRSLINITFNLATEALEKKLIDEATKAGFNGLKGHRSVGGLRASIYNAFPTKGFEDLVSFMKDFQKKNG